MTITKAGTKAIIHDLITHTEFDDEKGGREKRTLSDTEKKTLKTFLKDMKKTYEVSDGTREKGKIIWHKWEDVDQKEDWEMDRYVSGDVKVGKKAGTLLVTWYRDRKHEWGSSPESMREIDRLLEAYA